MKRFAILFSFLVLIVALPVLAIETRSVEWDVTDSRWSVDSDFTAGTGFSPDIGKSNHRWKDLWMTGDIYASGTINLGNLMIVGDTSSTQYRREMINRTDGDFVVSTANGDLTLRTNTTGAIVLNPVLSGQGTLSIGVDSNDLIAINGQVYTDILPAAGFGASLGSGSNSWNNIYASGTAYIEDDVKVNGLSVCLSNGTNCPSSYATLSITNLSSTMVTSTNIGLQSGGNILVNNANSKRSIILTSIGCQPSWTNGAVTTTHYETVTNKLNLFLTNFDATTTKYCEWTVTMPDNYDGGTVNAIFNWTSTTTGAGDVVWGVQAVGLSDNDAFDTAFGTAATTTDTFITSDDLHQSGAVTMTIGNTPTGGDIVQFRALREASDTTDTFGNWASLVSVKVEYGTNAYSD